MLKELCARTAKNPSNSAWLSILTEEVDNVVLNMDMIEGPVRYRKGKKVRHAVSVKAIRIPVNIIASACSGRLDGPF